MGDNAAHRPGYSIEMKPESLRDYAFPDGAAWTENLVARHR